MTEPIIDRYADARAALHKIERDRHVKVLFACESGSRAWGFPSADSDYDVRFFYSRPINSYLSLAARRDVIDHNDLPPSTSDIDLSGWDVLKALDLAGKSNPQVVEWLGSPVRYYEHKQFVDELADVMREFNPRAVAHHYASMAYNQYKNYVAGTGEKVRFKKYLYALRPLFCVMRMRADPFTMPPTSFYTLWELVKDTDDRLRSSELRDELARVLRMKADGAEADYAPRMPAIEAFITAAVVEARSTADKMFDGRRPDMMRLEELSRRTIREFG